MEEAAAKGEDRKGERPLPAAQRAVDTAYAALRQGILDSRWPAGTHMREQELANLVGVSRTPIREALRRLEADGLVTVVPNLGARVNDWSEADLDEIFALRALLESQAVLEAAARIGEAEIRQLETLAEAMDALVAAWPDVDYGQLSELNDRFHGLLIAAAGNRRLRQLLKQVVEMPLVVRTFRRYDRRDLTRSMSHHHEIVEALKMGDGVWAASIMKAHIQAGRAVFRAGG